MGGESLLAEVLRRGVLHHHATVKAKPETSTGNRTDYWSTEERWIAGSQLSQRHAR